MRIAYLINSEKYSYHKVIVQDFIKVIPGEIRDIATSNYMVVDEIRDEKYDAIIIFDLSAHIYKTTSDTLSFNKITSRIANILFRRVEEYKDVGYRQNLSSFLYISNRDNLERVKNKCEEVPNIDCFVDIFYKPETDEEHSKNIESITLWWESFKKEAMLNEVTDI